MNRFQKWCGGAALALLAGSAAQAALVQIVMEGVDFAYHGSGGATCDLGGGVGCFANGDTLTSMTFKVDGATQGTLLTNISLNALLQISPLINPTSNGTHALLGLAGDIFNAEINGVAGLFTDTLAGSVTFSNGGQSYAASGTSAISGAQSLPFGLTAQGVIAWSINGTGNCQGDLGPKLCIYSGSAEMSWNTDDVAVPAPPSGLLAGAALLGWLGLAGLRRRAAVRAVQHRR